MARVKGKGPKVAYCGLLDQKKKQVMVVITWLNQSKKEGKKT